LSNIYRKHGKLRFLLRLCSSRIYRQSRL